MFRSLVILKTYAVRQIDKQVYMFNTDLFWNTVDLYVVDPADTQTRGQEKLFNI